jgi:hypothetical protein
MKTEKIVVNIDEVRKRVNSPKEILEIGGTSLEQFKKRDLRNLEVSGLVSDSRRVSQGMHFLPYQDYGQMEMIM